MHCWNREYFCAVTRCITFSQKGSLQQQARFNCSSSNDPMETESDDAIQVDSYDSEPSFPHYRQNQRRPSKLAVYRSRIKNRAVSLPGRILTAAQINKPGNNNGYEEEEEEEEEDTIRKYKKSLSFSEDVTTIVQPSSVEEHHRRRSVVNKDFSLGQSKTNASLIRMGPSQIYFIPSRLLTVQHSQKFTVFSMHLVNIAFQHALVSIMDIYKPALNSKFIYQVFLLLLLV